MFPALCGNLVSTQRGEQVTDTSNPAYKHGHAPRNKFSPEYQSWSCMIQRCTNPKRDYYQHYGGRGITVCERWKTFTHFLEDMGVRPEGTSLDRIDPDKGYYKENCRWATPTEQAANKRPGKWDSIKKLMPSLIIDGFNTSELLHSKLKSIGQKIHEETVRELARELKATGVIEISRATTGRFRKNTYTCPHNGAN